MQFNIRLSFLLLIIIFSTAANATVITFNYSAIVTKDGFGSRDNPDVELGDNLSGQITLNTELMNGSAQYNNTQTFKFEKNASQANYTFDNKNKSGSYNHYSRKYHTGFVRIIDNPYSDEIKYGNGTIDKVLSISASSSENIFNSTSLANIINLPKMDNIELTIRGSSTATETGTFTANISSIELNELREQLISENDRINNAVDTLMSQYSTSSERLETRYARQVIPEVLSAVTSLKKAKNELDEISILIGISDVQTSAEALGMSIDYGTPDSIDNTLTYIETYYRGLAEVVCEGSTNDCYLELTSQSPAAISFQAPLDGTYGGFSFDFNFGGFDFDDYLFAYLGDNLLFGGYATDFATTDWVNTGFIDFSSSFGLDEQITIGMLTNDSGRILGLRNFRFHGAPDSTTINVPEPTTIFLMITGIVVMYFTKIKSN